MPHKTATSAEVDQRLTPILAKREGRYTRWVQHGNDRVLVDLIKAGLIEHKGRLEKRLTDDEQAAYEALLETSMGESCTRGVILADAARAYTAHCAEQVRQHGGEIVTERFRSGRRVERSVERFAPPDERQATAAGLETLARSRPRARGAGRPKGQSTRSSARSGDSGDDGLGESSDPEPPDARTCAWCGEGIEHLNKDARHCSPKHRVYAQRARDKANPDRVAERSAARQRTNGGVWTHLCDCEPKCNGTPKHNVVDKGLCKKCGHPRTADAVVC